MPFGPRTPSVASLGGSETAALELGKALGRRGHDVRMFCIIPPAPAPDHVSDGYQEDGVTYSHIRGFGAYAEANEHDLLIGLRDPQIVAMRTKSKKKVLWAHDIFTKRGMQRALDQMAWTFDEIWTVSEWHRQQVHEVTGYPLSNIVALRNGIVQYDDVETLYRGHKEILYAARPERGLDNLIRPGGVMENLPDYTLTVAMYEHFPEHMRGYYEQIMRRMKEMPNVKFVGGVPNHQLRHMIANAAAYIYPTQFEETSCVLARECIEQGTPFLTTREGALPETLGNEGIFFEDWLDKKYGGYALEKGSPEWCKRFAEFFRESMENGSLLAQKSDQMMMRTDLYWDGVAEMVEQQPIPDKVEQTIAAAMIAYNNEDTILRCLNSLVGQVDAIQIALGPCTDETESVIHSFAKKHPEIEVNVIEVPKIEPRKFGFDDARNKSVEGLEERFDWIFWIDTDEYLVGDIRRYLRNNALQSYLVSQHHFTVEPKGAPTQIDRPARIYRTKQGIKFRGHIHEHAEVPEGGPGRGYLLPDVDIGHTGYANEATRKARFERNFPFLQWEIEEGSDRKINHFLWLRDLVHRMRFEASKKNFDGAIALAKEAETYYNAHWTDMATFGPGVAQSLQYLGEIYTVLGKGVQIKFALALDDRNSTWEGKFESYEQFERIVRQLLEPEMKERAGRYY